MANARIAKFITEVAPPQFISVVRRRASKMLDTINEEERDVTTSDHAPSPSKTTSSASTSANGCNSANGAPTSFRSTCVQDYGIFIPDNLETTSVL
ncbi:hypothetical protein RJ641_017898 [Dillenia turbinata]|uniref:Uncharacterized protein n=1 Tax=Dillenia turbinata TaxID=194707 RepID=A0AAN8YY26_9MAGN